MSAATCCPECGLGELLYEHGQPFACTEGCKVDTFGQLVAIGQPDQCPECGQSLEWINGFPRGCLSTCRRWEHLFEPDDEDEQEPDPFDYASWPARHRNGQPPRQRDGRPDGLLIDMAEALRHADAALPFVIEPLALRGYLTVLVGRHSAGKSWLALLLGAAVHGGTPELAGFPLTRTPVLYVDAENGARLLARRFRSAEIPADGLIVADGNELRLPRDLELLGRLVEHTAAGLVMLDSLRRLAPGARENDSDDMAPIMAGLAMLARQRDVAVLLLHHRSVKDGSAPTRGSSAIEDQADGVFLLDRERSDAQDRRKLSVRKFRPDADPPTYWLRLGADPDSGRYALATADARPESSAASSGPSAEDRMADSIRALASQVAGEAGWEVNRLAEAVGTTPDSGTFKRAIGGLIESGEWEAEGHTRGGRFRPTIRAIQANPVGDGPNGLNDEAAERLSGEEAEGR